MNNWDEEYLKKIKGRLVDQAKQIINGEVELLLGCQQMVGLSYQLPDREREKSEQLFIGFVAIESENDDLPLGPEREHWNKDALKEKDKIRDQYASQVKDQVFEDCKKIINLYGVL